MTELVYLVTSNIVDGIKVGMWSNSANKLLSRYKTYFGKNTVLHYFICPNARSIETAFMQHFKDHKISNELFDKSDTLIEKYKEFLTNKTKSNCLTIPQAPVVTQQKTHDYVHVIEPTLKSCMLGLDKRPSNFLFRLHLCAERKDSCYTFDKDYYFRMKVCPKGQVVLDFNKLACSFNKEDHKFDRYLEQVINNMLEMFKVDCMCNDELCFAVLTNYVSITVYNLCKFNPNWHYDNECFMTSIMFEEYRTIDKTIDVDSNDKNTGIEFIKQLARDYIDILLCKVDA